MEYLITAWHMAWPISHAIFAFIVLLTIVVTVHEFGHFLAAKWCGVKVTHFCLGFGKPIISRLGKDGTIFGIAPYLVGGYVKFLDDTEDEIPESQKHLCFEHKSSLQRIAILAAGPLANFILAFLIFWGADFYRIVNVLPIVGPVEVNSPAERMGFKSGDKITSVDGKKTKSWYHVRLYLIDRIGETGRIHFTVAQDDLQKEENIYIPIDKWLYDAEDFNPTKALGLSVSRSEGVFQFREINFLEGLYLSALLVFDNMKLIFYGIGKIILGELSVDNVSGPIGISDSASQSMMNGYISFLMFIAAFSISIGVINFLPLFPMDGGRIVSELINIISFGKFPDIILKGVNAFGFYVVAAFYIFAISKDILKYLF